jgi:hypothetical protein
MEYIYLGREVESRRKEAWCPCGTCLEMVDTSLLPFCGDEECREYLLEHPDWYEKDGVE